MILLFNVLLLEKKLSIIETVNHSLNSTCSGYLLEPICLDSYYSFSLNNREYRKVMIETEMFEEINKPKNMSYGDFHINPILLRKTIIDVLNIDFFVKRS